MLIGMPAGGPGFARGAGNVVVGSAADTEGGAIDDQGADAVVDGEDCHR